LRRDLEGERYLDFVQQLSPAGPNSGARNQVFTTIDRMSSPQTVRAYENIIARLRAVSSYVFAVF
jgi:hypothetical protein